MSAAQSISKSSLVNRKAPTSLTQADQQRLFEALDMLQKQRADADVRTSSVLDAAAREEEMLESLRQLSLARGEVVNEEALRAAIRSTREPTNLVYARTPDGVSRKLANAYLARASWFPHSMIAIVIAALMWGGVSWRNHVVEENFKEAVASNSSAVVEVGSQIAALSDAKEDWLSGPGQRVHLASFEGAIEESSTALQQAQSALVSPTPNSVRSAEEMIKKSKLALAAAVKARQDSRKQAALIERAKEVAAAPDDKSWPEVNTRKRARMAQLDAALSAGNLSQATAALAAINALSGASSTRSTLYEAANLVPPVAREEAMAIRSSGEAALLNADIASAEASIAALRRLTDAVSSAYTMKIVNENGVQSGVWRYPNDNPNARNYYVVVDAIDTSGNPVKVSVVNEETGQAEVVSRFAVRVAEAVYESVKEDKLDNGLIDNPVVGIKSPGMIEPEYSVDTAGGGIITRW